MTFLLADLFVYLSLGDGDNMNTSRYTTVVTGPVSWVPSANNGTNFRTNGAIYFTDNDQSLQTSFTRNADTCPFDIGKCHYGLSIAFWIKIDANGQTSGYKNYIKIGNNGNFDMYHNHATNDLSVVLRNGTKKWYGKVPANLGDGWHHLAINWITGAAWVIFKDGNQASRRSDTSDQNIGSPASLIKISGSASFVAPFAMDEMYVWTSMKPEWFMQELHRL